MASSSKPTEHLSACEYVLPFFHLRSSGAEKHCRSLYVNILGAESSERLSTAHKKYVSSCSNAVVPTCKVACSPSMLTWATEASVAECVDCPVVELASQELVAALDLVDFLGVCKTDSVSFCKLRNSVFQT